MTKPLKLKLRDAKRIAIELWTWLAETGKCKEDWPGYEKYGKMFADCPFCEYNRQFNENKVICECCPYYKVYGHCCDDGEPYFLWLKAETDEERKRYAGEFLVQLETLCCNFGSLYDLWDKAETDEERKRYAGEFLARLKTLEKEG